MSKQPSPLDMLREFKARKKSPQSDVPEVAVIDVNRLDEDLKKWSAFHRYLVSELERMIPDIGKRRAMTVVKNAVYNCIECGEKRKG